VQGVWFRDSTRREAERLGISGYARNLPNGDVEVLATGTDAAVAELLRWLHEGPPLSKVSEVLQQVSEQRTAQGLAPAGFEIR